MAGLCAPEMYGLGVSFSRHMKTWPWTIETHSMPYSSHHPPGYTDYSSMGGRGYRGGQNLSQDYVNTNTMFQTTNGPPFRGSFIIAPDWVSERKGLKQNLSHFTSSRDPSRFRYGSY